MKAKQGGTGGNQFNKQTAQNDTSANTAEVLSEQYGVSEATIKRDGQFAAAVEELEAVIPDITQKVLSGDIVKKGVINSLKSQNLTQEKIGERIGWTQEQVSRHQTINEVIMPDILKMALEHQKGRGIDEYAQGHNFTERWFRGTNPR